MTTVDLPKSLSQFTQGQTSVQVNAANLGEALRQLSGEHNMGDVLLSENGELQPYVRVFLNNALIRNKNRKELDRIDVQDTRVELKTAFAGG